ncbi:GIY-YIG nuclease family protein [Streptomyces violaceus]|uniref:GIY-YIG nuclease family protein n=1 Tax=Streptomyces violaceus TaxID=1936 RepID=A0ABY9UP11_STRVL|nr:GIY-YIG nuclease family protein [Streptomyces janthinus]WND24079.1 GIY-YIG nuclease family protein [Streptomyces janthinus]GGS96348.1 hypothetical protein GCM10010270_80390 [Streptomyces janthinus]
MDDGRPADWTAIAAQTFDWTAPQQFEDRFQVLTPEHEKAVLDRLLRPHQPVAVDKTYLIGMEGSPFVKIGYTSGDPKARLARLQTGQPAQMSLLWSTEGFYESALHKRFAAHRVRGEWFDLSSLGDPVAVVEAAVEEIKLSSAD